MSSDFIGKGWGFPPRFNAPDSGPNMAEEDTLIRQALHIVLNTQVGERPLMPEYGSGLGHFMFAAADMAVLADLKSEVANAVVQHEGRVKLLEVTFDSSELQQGLLNIGLEYQIKQTNSRSNMVFPYYLSEKSI